MNTSQKVTAHQQVRHGVWSSSSLVGSVSMQVFSQVEEGVQVDTILFVLLAQGVDTGVINHSDVIFH